MRMPWKLISLAWVLVVGSTGLCLGACNDDFPAALIETAVKEFERTWPGVSVHFPVSRPSSPPPLSVVCATGASASDWQVAYVLQEMGGELRLLLVDRRGVQISSAPAACLAVVARRIEKLWTCTIEGGSPIGSDTYALHANVAVRIAANELTRGASRTVPRGYVTPFGDIDTLRVALTLRLLECAAAEHEWSAAGGVSTDMLSGAEDSLEVWRPEGYVPDAIFNLVATTVRAWQGDEACIDALENSGRVREAFWARMRTGGIPTTELATILRELGSRRSIDISFFDFDAAESCREVAAVVGISELPNVSAQIACARYLLFLGDSPVRALREDRIDRFSIEEGASEVLVQLVLAAWDAESDYWRETAQLERSRIEALGPDVVDFAEDAFGRFLLGGGELSSPIWLSEVGDLEHADCNARDVKRSRNFALQSPGALKKGVELMNCPGCLRALSAVCVKRGELESELLDRVVKRFQDGTAHVKWALLRPMIWLALVGRSDSFVAAAEEYLECCRQRKCALPREFYFATNEVVRATRQGKRFSTADRGVLLEKLDFSLLFIGGE